jgi:17beta-estradiol 17-dehydrogenase / very-long-chain 3-oxoacyl-CoA reductase
LVTGCTSGIGEGFVEVLAERGWNLLLVSRSASKLEKLRSRILSDRPAIQARIVVSDAASLDSCETDRVFDACADLSLRILVNNVGISAGGAGPLGEYTRQQLEEMIHVNCRYPSLLTHALLPQLKRGASSTSPTCIIDVVSQVSLLHVPWCAGYSASKSYNLAWSHALHDELRGEFVEVFALTPGMVVSAMSDAREPSLMVASAKQCANSALNAVGLRDHCGYWSERGTSAHA